MAAATGDHPHKVEDQGCDWLGGEVLTVLLVPVRDTATVELLIERLGHLLGLLADQDRDLAWRYALREPAVDEIDDGLRFLDLAVEVQHLDDAFVADEILVWAGGCRVHLLDHAVLHPAKARRRPKVLIDGNDAVSKSWANFFMIPSRAPTHAIMRCLTSPTAVRIASVSRNAAFTNSYCGVRKLAKEHVAVGLAESASRVAVARQDLQCQRNQVIESDLLTLEAGVWMEDSPGADNAVGHVRPDR